MGVPAGRSVARLASRPRQPAATVAATHPLLPSSSLDGPAAACATATARVSPTATLVYTNPAHPAVRLSTPLRHPRACASPGHPVFTCGVCQTGAATAVAAVVAVSRRPCDECEGVGWPTLSQHTRACVL